jgi:membrane protein required for colicin V production
MEFNYFDLVITVIILFLGLKGIINGFFKEVFGLVGIIGGIFIASRFGDDVGEYLNNAIFMFQSQSAISFTGFLATLFVFWLIMIVIGLTFKKLTSMSGLSPLDRFFGFIFGASKFFLIASVIAHSLYNINSIKKTLDPMMEHSVLFPIMTETGAFIMKLDPVILKTDLEKGVKSAQESIKNSTDTLTNNVVNDMIDSKN